MKASLSTELYTSPTTIMLKNIEVSILIHQYSNLQLSKMVFTAQYT